MKDTKKNQIKLLEWKNVNIQEEKCTGCINDGLDIAEENISELENSHNKYLLQKTEKKDWKSKIRSLVSCGTSGSLIWV
jgi:hypothetical protein